MGGLVSTIRVSSYWIQTLFFQTGSLLLQIYVLLLQRFGVDPKGMTLCVPKVEGFMMLVFCLPPFFLSCALLFSLSLIEKVDDLTEQRGGVSPWLELLKERIEGKASIQLNWTHRNHLQQPHLLSNLHSCKMITSFKLDLILNHNNNLPMGILPYCLTLLLFIPSLSQNNRPCDVPTISVSSKGTASGTPDTATFNVEVQTTSSTSLQATQSSNTKLAQVTQILSNNKIPSTDIQISALTISPKYDYSQGNYPYPVIGQDASISLTVIVNTIDPNGTAIGTLYDQLSGVNGVLISGLSFDIKNKTSLKRVARAQAYSEAIVKAQQFALLSGYKVGSPQLINEQASFISPIIPLQRAFAVAQSTTSPTVGTAVATGSFQVSVTCEYTFLLQ